MIPSPQSRREEVSEPPSSLSKKSGTRRARPSEVLVLLVAFFAIAAVDPPSQPILLSPEQAAKEGQALVAEILAQKPAENSTNTGVMTIREAKNKRTQIPIQFTIQLTPTNWMNGYRANLSNHVEILSITHLANQSNTYTENYQVSIGTPPIIGTSSFGPLRSDVIWAPFSDSDFSIADLGLEFLHWPDQHLTKKEMKRSRSCKVLESINPKPAPNSYSRVVSWIDNESDGIVMAQAYDAQGKLLKEFIPKKVKKVEGQWQLEEMEIDNDQTGSSTKVDFDLSR